MRRSLKPEILIVENLKTLLRERRIEAQSLAMWCGHRSSWISKILSGERGLQIRELGKIADFFGLTVADLFQHGITPLAERRSQERRSERDRRTGKDRREPERSSRYHPDLALQNPKRFGIL